MRLFGKCSLILLFLSLMGTAEGAVLFSDSFNYPNGPIPDSSSPWDVTSGVMNADNGEAWTNSGVFRVITDRNDFRNVTVSFRFLNKNLTTSSGESWNGAHIFLRYQSEFHLYALSFNRRDNRIVIKKKLPGGSSNGGTYYDIGASKSHTVPYNSWQNIKASIQTLSNGSVNIKLFSGTQTLFDVIDNGIGGAPITAAGKVGIRTDYDNVRWDDFAVSDESSDLSESFSSYVKNTCFADNTAFGPWSVAFNGFGCVQVKSDASGSWLSLSPAPSVTSLETHGALVLGPSYPNPLTWSTKLTTVAQLRKNSPPNPWEVGWIAWHYTDDDHFYYFYPSANGWELGKRDPAYPGGQRFLTTGTSPKFPLGNTYTVKVVHETSNKMTVYVDGQLITSFTDQERPYSSGRIGLYTEDAHVHFDDVTASPSLPSDVTPPSISGVSSSNIRASSATISWTTNEASDSQVEYGLTNSYGQTNALNTAMVTSHQMNLTGLSSGTLYHYRVKSKDAAGNLAVSANFTFLTPDITPPVLSAMTAFSIEQSSATIFWATNEASDSQVEYGTAVSYGHLTALNSAAVTSHTVVLTNLASGTLYHYRVKSKDAIGNLTVSADSTFTTLQPISSPPPGACIQSALSWKNQAFTSQTGSFRAEFDATPGGSAIDGVIGLSKGISSAYSSLAAIVRFNTSGIIDARNGSAYAASASIPYTANASYHFRLEINLSAHTYSVYVKPALGTEKLLANNFAFRTEQNTVTSLNNLASYASAGSQTVCGLQTTPTPSPSPTLLNEPFSYPDGLITNEFAYWNPTSPSAVHSPVWDVTSGALYAAGGAGSTGGTESAVFRMVTDKSDFNNVAVNFSLLNSGLYTTSRTPSTAWDGVHIFLRYQSEYQLYYASINRRDNTIIIKKKMPGGSSNGGTYYDIGSSRSHTVPYNTWQNIKATIQTNPNGSVTIQLFSDSTLLLNVTDSGTGGAPITAAGKTGIRGDNANLKFDNFTVTSLGAGTAADTAASPQAAAGAKAEQKFLSPSLADGINDTANFGPDAQEVQIFDIRGRPVFHATRQGSPIIWNCRDEWGQLVESGVYIAKIHATGGPFYQSFAVVK